MDVFEAIHTRRSVKKLAEPVPTDADLQTMFEAAVMAPDHKELAPWRFIVIQGDGLTKLGAVMASAARKREPDVSDGKLEKERSKPLRAPMIIAVAAKRLETKLDFSELVHATAAATQNLLLAAHALGYGAIWRSGASVLDSYVKESLGLTASDELLGFFYIGTSAAVPESRSPRLDGVVSSWP